MTPAWRADVAALREAIALLLDVPDNAETHEAALNASESVTRLEARLEGLEWENDVLRGIAATIMPCHYCGAEDMSKCPRGFPGCSLRMNRRSGGWEGRRHSDETRALISAKASRPKPWLRGELNGMAGRTGSSNPNWKGGVTPERQALYASRKWREVARAVKRRDGGCAECHSAVELHVHHVLSFAEHPELRLDADNLVTLCRRCHYEKHRKEVRHQ